MAVFFLAEIEAIHDPDTYAEYVELAAAIIRQHGGEYVLRSQKLTPVSGAWDTKRVVLIRFDSFQQLRRCFQSQAYRAIAPLRERSAASKAIVIGQD